MIIIPILMIKLLGRLRKKYEESITPLCKSLGNLGVTPNAATTLSLLLACLAAVGYASRSPLWAAFGLLASAAADMVDGGIARATGKATRFGAVYDHVLDRYAEFAILVGIGLGGFADWHWVVFSLFGMVMASFVRAKAESVGGLKSCSVGIAERQEKLILILLGSILQVFFGYALLLAVVIVGVVSHITVVQRLQYTFTQTRGVDHGV